MAIVGNITLQGNLSGAPIGSLTFGPTQQLFSAAVGAVTIVSLTNGNVTVTVPSNTTVTACVLFPPNATSPKPSPSYGGTITLKGSSGDTGVVISNTYTTYIPWDLGTAPSSFVLTATASGTLEAWFA